MTREERRYWRRQRIKAMVTLVLALACVALIEAISA